MQTHSTKKATSKNGHAGARAPRPHAADEGGEGRALSEGQPSAPLLGVLPIARLIPQDIHSVMDYVDAATAGIGLASSCPKAKAASAFLAISGAGVSALTDYKLSVAKVIPIETHEAIDHLWGLTAIALPFALGYWKTAPRVALAHVVVGAGNILASLVTDYRAYRGRGRRKGD